jgi:hypothetical protein
LEKSFHPEPPKGEHQQSLPFGHLTCAFHRASGNQRFQNYLINLCIKEKLKTFSADKLKLELAK